MFEKIKEMPVKKPDPKPEPKPKAIEPKPEKKPRVKAKPRPKPVAKARPKKTSQKKRMTLASLLKSVEKLKKTGRSSEREKETSNRQRGSQRHDPSVRLSSSELDALRRQLARCWNVPAGARDAKTLIVDIKVSMNRNRTVRRAQIVDLARTRRDPFGRDRRGGDAPTKGRVSGG